MKKLLHFAVIMLMLITLTFALGTALVSCGGGGDTNNDQKGDEGGDDDDTPTPSGKVDYTVTIKTIGGRPVPNLTFHIFEEDDLVSYGQTDKDGYAKVSLVPSDKYTIELSASSLEGYIIEDRYSFTNKAAHIVLTSEVIADTDLTGVRYELGDIIRDFSVVTSDGSTFKLSEALKTKKAVLINFWYSTCGPCVNEFPYMQSAYEKYSDEIEVIALNNYAGDNENSVKEFKATMGLTFPVAKDYSRLGSAFNITGYPTSILIDRYGTICLIEVGGLTSEKPFVAVFDHFTSNNYEQKLITSIDELTPIEKPDIEMPSSDEIGAALNGSGFNAEYTPETESSDADYSWPFLVGTKDGVDCVYTSNAYKDNSFATLHATVELKANEALAVDWFSDTELGADTLFILVDGKDIYRISGTSEDWKTCFPYVAVEDGTYDVTFIYVKDSDTDVGEDKIYLSNMRTVAINEISAETYIPRQAATKPNANGLGFGKYVTAVYNDKDGYYHVGTADGPLLLVNLMSGTLLNETSLNDLGYNGDLQDSQGDVYEVLVDYCNYAINGTMYGYSPVTEELKSLLERAAEIIGYEQGNANQWLQTCIYYDAYATNGKQLEDPVKGIAFFAAFDTVLSTEGETNYNVVEYDGRVIMPRGLKYKFIPSKSGAYLIKSQSTEEVNGWIFNDKCEVIYTASVVERPYVDGKLDTTNVSVLIYFEEGKEYYIDIAYYDIYAEGKFTFTIEYVAESCQQLHIASPGYFTYIETSTGQVNQTIAGGIDVALGEDGYYHELREDGTLGSIVYADFKFSTGLFSHSILKMIELDGFNFTYNETDLIVLAKLKELGGNVDACRAYYTQIWGDDYAEWEAIYKLDEVLAGIYHGGGTDRKSEILEYVNKMLTASDAPAELEGCVKVDAALANLLQALMDKYSLEGVNHSWTKLCYYYKDVAP